MQDSILRIYEFSGKFIVSLRCAFELTDDFLFLCHRQFALGRQTVRPALRDDPRPGGRHHEEGRLLHRSRRIAFRDVRLPRTLLGTRRHDAQVHRAHEPARRGGQTDLRSLHLRRRLRTHRRTDREGPGGQRSQAHALLLGHDAQLLHPAAPVRHRLGGGRTAQARKRSRPDRGDSCGNRKRRARFGTLQARLRLLVQDPGDQLRLPPLHAG